MSNSKEIRQFIINYLTYNLGTDACDAKFHDEFHDRFGGSRHHTWWGAQYVYKAQRYLKLMYNEGILMRTRISLGDGLGQGFPHWVYSYSLAKRTDND